MLSSLDERFARRAGSTFPNVANVVPLGGVPHHSFHVFAVYPWLGLLRAGRQGPALDVLDQCRVRWGRVVSAGTDTAVVCTSTLAFSESRLVLAGEHEMRAKRLARQSDDPALRAGDLVSLHWDWICETLSPARARRLQAYTRKNLDAVNALAVPGPAIAASGAGG